MLLHGFLPASRANGPGLRAVVWFQGCRLNCRECWNPETHPFEGSESAAMEIVARLGNAMRTGNIDGVTFSGGEPMQQALSLFILLKNTRDYMPELSLGLFTGYTELELRNGSYWTHEESDQGKRRIWWEDICGLLDFAVMGRYDHNQPGADALCTSRNQRLLLFSDRYQPSDFGPQLVEVTIGERGGVVTGFPVLGFPVAREERTV